MKVPFLLLFKNWLDIDNLMWFNLSSYHLGLLGKLNVFIYVKYLLLQNGNHLPIDLKPMSKGMNY